LTTGGAQISTASGNAAISQDSRYIAFVSSDPNVVAGDTNGYADIFVHDRATGNTTRVSVGTGGVQANGYSRNPAFSGDGRFVAFESAAPNLAPGDTMTFPEDDVYVHDRQTGVTVRVSNLPSGVADDFSTDPSLSATGRYVAFSSANPAIVPGGTQAGVYVHDRDVDADGIYDEPGLTSMERVSVATTGVEANGTSEHPAISADGLLVSFDSTATNLATSVGPWNVYVRDRVAGTTTLVSVSSQGDPGDGFSSTPAVSADGRIVTFSSSSSNLVADDTNTCPGVGGNCPDVFAHDRQTGITERVSVSTSGAQTDGYSQDASINADGRFITFWSHASNLVPGDSNSCLTYLPSCPDVFLRDRLTGATTRLSVDSAGNQASGASQGSRRSAINDSGRFVAFDSDAINLVPNDTNMAGDVFLRDLGELDFDGDGAPDHLDMDDDSDGYTDVDENGKPVCLGSVNDDNFDDGSANDGCPADGASELSCAGAIDDDSDTLVNDGCPQAGTLSEAAYNLGTSVLGPCSLGSAPSPSPSWPSDLVSAGVPNSTDKVTITDLTSFLAPARRLDSSPGSVDFSSRWDLVPGRGLFVTWIAINDLTALLAGSSGYPPMFGGVRAFNGPICSGP
jgi:Tol biopolymer transport system component